MEPNNETEKEVSGKDKEQLVHEEEFKKCSRKGRRDACADIHCKCGALSDSECHLHKEAIVAGDGKETKDDKT